MISVTIGVNQFAQIRSTLEEKFGDDPFGLNINGFSDIKIFDVIILPFIIIALNQVNSIYFTDKFLTYWN